jgi:hypothetical protein
MVRPWYKNKDVKATILEVGNVPLEVKNISKFMDKIKSYSHLQKAQNL